MDESGHNSARGVLICANPFSGSGPNRSRVDGLVGALSGRGLDPRVVWGLDERRAVLSDPGLASWCRCVVVAGGDGSIGAVVNELGEAGALPGPRASGDSAGRVAFATLPIGNENLFAKHYGFTGDAQAMAQAIEAGRTRRVDLGRVTHLDQEGPVAGRLFTLMAGVGFDAEVVHRMDRWRSARKGGLRRVRRVSYLPRIVSASVGYRYPTLSVEVDGQAVSGTHLFIFNLPEYGGGLGLAPQGCCADNGLLDWVLFDRPGVAPLLGYGLSVLRGRHLARGDVQHGRAKRIEVRCDTAAPIQVDGDPSGTAPAVVGIEDQRCLELLITR